MKSASFGNLQLGMIDNPSIEDQGGFEFASGMDIFSEPGVMKASFALVAVSGLPAIHVLPKAFITVISGGVLYGYLSIDDMIYESTDGINWSLFLTNSIGAIDNLFAYNGYLYYTSNPKLGRTLVHNAAGKNDTWQTLSAALRYPMNIQGGTLKIGNGRYISSIDEASAFTSQAFKIPSDYAILSMANYQNGQFIGSTLGTGFETIQTEDATSFYWDGIVLSSGSALPNSTYHLSKRGMNALIATGQGLFGFPDKKAEIFVFNGARFVPFRQLTAISNNTDLLVTASNACEHFDNVLFSGDSSYFPGIFQLKGNAVCQAYVPSLVTPGATNETIQSGFVASGFDGKIFHGYFRAADNNYHVEYLGSNRQNNAVVRTVWHRMKTDKIKRWGGVKLNLKNMPASTSVKVEYRTDRKAAFTDPGISITSSNQNKAAIFAAQPRSQEIQYRFTYTTSGANTPELLSYDPLFQALNTVRV